jgi:hypothetical protein
MMYRAIIGWAIASLCILTLPVWAVEYRLQVTNIDYLIFSSYLDRSGTSPKGKETMQVLEARLDNMEFPIGYRSCQRPASRPGPLWSGVRIQASVSPLWCGRTWLPGRRCMILPRTALACSDA